MLLSRANCFLIIFEAPIIDNDRGRAPITHIYIAIVFKHNLIIKSLIYNDDMLCYVKVDETK